MVIDSDISVSLAYVAIWLDRTAAADEPHRYS